MPSPRKRARPEVCPECLLLLVSGRCPGCGAPAQRRGRGTGSRRWAPPRANPAAPAKARVRVPERRKSIAGFPGLAKKPGFHKAVAAHKKFHQVEPSTYTLYQIDDGRPGVRDKVVASLGDAPNIEYEVPNKDSNKDGYLWNHKFSEKKPKPEWVLDPDTGLPTLVGGNFTITDWWREKNEKKEH